MRDGRIIRMDDEQPAAFAVDLTELAVYLATNCELTRPIEEQDIMDAAYRQAARMLRAVGLPGK